jgi:tetratricopeptide (TPR) repeat protein
MASLERAIELGERARSNGAADSRTLLALARAYSSRGMWSYDAAKLGEARRDLMLSIERARDPQTGPEGLSVISVSSRWLGRMEIDYGSAGQAVKWSEEAVHAAEEMVQQTGSVKARLDLIGSELYLARDAVVTGNLELAAELSHKAALLGSAVREAAPQHADARLAYVEGLLGAGDGYFVPSDIPGMIVPLDLVRKAVSFARQEVAENPKVRRWSTWLFCGYSQLSFGEEDPKAAETAARQALAVVEEQLAAGGQSLIFVRNLAEARIRLGDCLRSKGDRIGAAEQAALAIREVAGHRAQRESKAATVQATLLLGNVHLDARDRAQAAERFEAARKVAEPMVTADPTDLRMAAFLAMTYEGLGKSAGDGKSAASAFSKSVALWKLWVAGGKSKGYGPRHLREAERLLAGVAR